MTRITLALIVCAGLGFAAGKHQPNPPAVACSPAKPAEILIKRSETQPAETPLVEKLIPTKPWGDKKVRFDRDANAYIDGQKTADGLFQYEYDRNIFVPVELGHPHYVENGHPVTRQHLVVVHGNNLAAVEKWTRAEMEIAHANIHWWEKTHNAARAAAPVRSSGCPGGVCPSPSSGRGLFGRRR